MYIFLNNKMLKFYNIIVDLHFLVATLLDGWTLLIKNYLLFWFFKRFWSHNLFYFIFKENLNRKTKT